MRYGIFSDVHSNIEALEATFAAYAHEAIDCFLCIGDIVGYAANPRECLEVITARSIKTVAGNHDWGCVGKFDTEYFNPYAQEALRWTAQQLNENEKRSLAELDLTYAADDFILVHGTLSNPHEFEYMTTRTAAQETFQALRQTICFVGHTHIPGVFTRVKERIDYDEYESIAINPSFQYIVNVGSVGQPRDGDNRACFCIYDSDQKSIELKRVAYDITATQRKIINAGLPHFLAQRLERGQ